MEKNGLKNGSLNYDTILSLDLYCHKMEKWTEVPYVQAFKVLYQNPALRGSCNQKPGQSETPDILDDPLLTFPNSQGKKPSFPCFSRATSFSGDTYFFRSLWLIPYSASLCSFIPQKGEINPSRVTHSGTVYHPGSGKVCPLREVANVEGTIRMHGLFSLTDLAQWKQRLGWFSEDSSKFVEEFQALTLACDLTWKDVQIVLSICCTPREKQNLGSNPGAWWPDQLQHYAMGRDAHPTQEANWNYNSWEGTEARKHIIQCVLERMIKCIKKPVNYEKVKGVTQEEK